MAELTSFPTSGTSALQSAESQAQLFFRTLTHDDRSSFYCIARHSKHSGWVESFSSSAQLSDYYLFDTDADWYISRNGFTQRSRKTQRIRQINAFMFDLDCHQLNNRNAVESGICAVKSAVFHGLLPEPTMIVDTGRGLHLYYVLEHSLSFRLRGGAYNEKGVAFFKDVETKLAAVIKQIIQDVPALELDTAVFDFSRVGRIPGTYNTKASRICSLIHCSGVYYALSQLANACTELLGMKKQRYVLPANNDILAVQASVRTKHKQESRFILFDKLSLSRVDKIFKLQQVRGFDCMGNRELMCFCLYNAAVQVYQNKGDAFERLENFNARFVQPLEHSVLLQIAASVSKVGFYKMSASTMVRKLKMTSLEIEKTAFFESRRVIEREQAKRATAEKRSARNALIVELYSRPGATMKSVAQAVGVCKRTVASVLKAAKIQSSGVKSVSDSANVAVKRGLTDLKLAAQSTLSASNTKGCNFLADVFRCVCSSTLGVAHPALSSDFFDAFSFQRTFPPHSRGST